jgi:hypothetical protein
MKARPATTAGLVLAALHVAALSAAFLAPYVPTAQNRALPYAPPTRLHFVDGSGRWHGRPFVYAWAEDEPGTAR